MSKRVTSLIAATLLTAAGASAGDAGDAAAVAEMCRTAESFTRMFVEGRDKEALELMTAAMREAQSPERAAQLRASLLFSHGKVNGTGDCWRVDRMQGYHRFRVPVNYETVTLDYQLALDGGGKVAGFSVQPHVASPDATKPPFRELDIEVGDGETALPGTLTLPDGDGPFPGVVLVHGSGPNDRDETVGPNRPFRDIAWGLAARGVATLRYDKRSFARAGDLAALGNEATADHEVVDDARAALQRLRERPEVDAASTYVAGHSLGGMLAPRIAAASPRPAGIVVLAGPTIPLTEKLLQQHRYLSELDGRIDDAERGLIEAVENEVVAFRKARNGEAEPPTGRLLGSHYGYWANLEEEDPPARAAALALPIFVLQGKRDYQVTMEDYRGWTAALEQKPFACLFAYDGLDHLLRPGQGASSPADYERAVPVADSVVDDIAAWIKMRRCPSD